MSLAGWLREQQARWPRHDGRWERQIDALALQRDATDDVAEQARLDVAVTRILIDHVFPLELFVSTDLGQLRTFAIPSISGLLHSTGRYERTGPRRLDDTKAILMEILDAGPETAAGHEMIAHLQAIHGHYRIRNDDYLMTLSVFVVDAIRFAEAWGWRAMRPHEARALHGYYRLLGERMGIAGIPATWQELAVWRDAYEARTRRHTKANTAVALGLLAAAEGIIPEPLAALRPLLTPAAGVMLDDAVRDALGLPVPRRRTQRLVRGIWALWRRARRRVNPWADAPFTQSAFFRHLPTYPDGYERLRLGPVELMATTAKPAGCPAHR